MAYDKGAVNIPNQYNFTSFQSLDKPDNDSKLVQPFKNTLSGIFKEVGSTKATTSQEYSWWEKNRLMPLPKATNAGAGSGAGAAVVFTLDASSKTAFGSYDPYNTNTTKQTSANPVRKFDVLLLRPSTGIASTGNYMHLIVTAVTSSTFTVEPQDKSLTIPSVPSAIEIPIIGNIRGEGAGFQDALSTSTTKYTENLQMISHKYKITGSDKLNARWVEELGANLLHGEKDAYLQFLKLQDLTMLLGEKMSNVDLADDFIDGTLGTNNPVQTTNGLFKQVSTGGQTLAYSAIGGVTLADLWDYNSTINKEGADMENVLYVGIDLDQQLDRELGDRFSYGAISYGTFNFTQEKAVNLQFSKMKIGSQVYNKKCLETLNDRQNTAAEGMGYSYEGLMLPQGTTKKLGNDEESGQNVSTVRKRFLANRGESREAKVTHFNGLLHSDNGVDIEEMRYLAHIGVEVQARNKTGLWKRA